MSSRPSPLGSGLLQSQVHFLSLSIVSPSTVSGFPFLHVASMLLGLGEGLLEVPEGLPGPLEDLLNAFLSGFLKVLLCL